MPLVFHAPDEAIVEAESTLTDRFQTTVPDVVRRALKLERRDKIRYVVRPSGEVVMQRATGVVVSHDPALEPFLDLLERDIAQHPERLRALRVELLARIDKLTNRIEIDLDAPLPDED
ncbi:type II toxin-antitoxin system PrlF family antitoxin [Cupriavidus sp. SIMBA_020]|uniref:type II toxin-antitoxin system PrlF family antitoxin n=1 Tax=Cupriavidus sp. SIMBA_020 TaxID=3085766 RepID=UPI00397C1099